MKKIDEGYLVVSKKPDVKWVSERFLNNRIDTSYYDISFLKTDVKVRSSGIKLKTLKDIAKTIVDGPHDSYKFVEEGILFIRSQNVNKGYFDLQDKKFITKEFNEKMKNSQVKQNDILLTRIGEYFGNAAVATKRIENVNINHAIAKITLKEEYNPWFYSAFFNSVYGYNLIRRQGRSFTSPRINMTDLRELIIPIPSPEIQKYIGDKVREAERLGDEARKLKEEAERILRMNLKQNLDDVDDKRKYNVIEPDVIVDRIDADFFQPRYNKIASLNIKKVKLGDIANVSNEKIDDNYNGKIKYVTISSIQADIIDYEEMYYKDAPKRAKMILRTGDLLISKLAGSREKVALIPKHLDGSIGTNGIAVIRSKLPNITNEYLFIVFSNELFNIQVERYSTGSIMSGISNKDILRFVVPILDQEQIDKITNLIKIYLSYIYKSKQLVQEAKQDVEDLIEGKISMKEN